ncbi:Pet127-domain-containing protein [Aspergillus steynii IBT 23096]|uniref:Pet127-domain-containing protein n=1 Tax=Aspergillus steynii IBT 23096 TaxID=1392250 RepID=A0A2I2G9C6_9EURO|nr:Pet127-domain-containing protein [Aspergillus steynii IBT 23096]PLB49487.1 Pet127-domain-containing protein [Aspergillus steynii IBT 23096]
MFRASLRSIAGPLREHVCFSCLAQGLRGRNNALRPFYSTAVSLSSGPDKQPIPESESNKGSPEEPEKPSEKPKRSPRRPRRPRKKPEKIQPPKHAKPRDTEKDASSSTRSEQEDDKSGEQSPKPAGSGEKSPRRKASSKPSEVPKDAEPRDAEKKPMSPPKITRVTPSTPSKGSPPFSVFMSIPGRKEGGTINSKDFALKPLDVETPPVPRLSFGLERVLFNPGVYQLRDPRSRVYNFDPYLGSIMPVTEFDFASLKDYITSSKDNSLRNIAQKEKKKYIGSSSSMTSSLSHFHYLLSAWRGTDIRTLSQEFPDKLRTFTRLLRAPSAMFLKYQDGVYAIDADKEFDSANILMNLGKSMEKLLTLPKEEFERYRRSSENKISPEEEQAVPESYHYSTLGDFVMRSQLDAYDPRLPGTGMFDLKTRAVVSIRMDAQNFEHGLGYEIRDRYGAFESYEREFYDMIRAAFLKYSLQVRIGRMDGIFVAFHNIQRIFGFQYVSLPEMDLTLHGQKDTSLGDHEFRLSVSLWNKVLDKVTSRFPKQSVRLHFETRDSVNAPFMYIFAEPVTDEEIHAIQTKNQKEIDAYQQRILDLAPREDSASTPSQDGSQDASPPPTNQTTEEQSDVMEDEGRHYDSSAPPDESFLSDMQKQAEEGDSDKASLDNGKELLAMSLMVRNKVNDKYVTRPSGFTEKDDWFVEYGLSEIEGAHAHDLYKACQQRRAKALAGRGEDETEVAANVYIRKLREITKAGRVFRAKEDMKDKQDGIVVLNEVD